jgi:hypothetical protein
MLQFRIVVVGWTKMLYIWQPYCTKYSGGSWVIAVLRTRQLHLIPSRDIGPTQGTILHRFVKEHSASTWPCST